MYKTKIKTQHQIELMKKAGKIVALVHNLIEKESKPGVNTFELDSKAYELIKKEGGIPTFLNYEGYKFSTCISINEVLVHGVPSKNIILKEGDILSIDVGVNFQGMNADAARTFIVGSSSNPKHILMVKTIKEILQKVIILAKDGNYLNQIGEEIERLTKETPFTISKEFGGHFIGEHMHEDPIILNFSQKNKGLRLKEGMTLCIEPILIDGKEEIFIDEKDGWTVKTKHKGVSAHEEHTVLVGKEKGIIITKI